MMFPGTIVNRKMPRVSIVTISFNQAQFLERTIQSVLAQDYPDIEYIVVDPGSTDGSRDIIERYRLRISKIIYRPDDGAPDGLNHGFAESTGDILGFLNSDDLLASTAVTSAVRYLEKHPAIDVVSGHSDLIDPDDRFLRHLYSNRMSVTRFIYGGCILMQPSTFFKSAAYRQTPGFNVKNKVNFDGEIFLQMAMNGAKFSVVDEVWSSYRVHPQSITGSRSSRVKVQEAQAEMFRLVKGRRPHRFDRLLVIGGRILRHMLNPTDTWERIRRGPVFARRLV